MARQRFTGERIAVARSGRPRPVRPPEAIRRRMGGVGEPTPDRRGKQSAGMGVAEIRRLRRPEGENARLGGLVAGPTPDRAMPRDVPRRKRWRPPVAGERGYLHGVGIDFSGPGEPADGASIAAFNARPPAGGAPDRLVVPVAAGRRPPIGSRDGGATTTATGPTRPHAAPRGPTRPSAAWPRGRSSPELNGPDGSRSPRTDIGGRSRPVMHQHSPRTTRWGPASRDRYRRILR